MVLEKYLIITGVIHIMRLQVIMLMLKAFVLRP